MAREYARIRISIGQDDDFELLSPTAQWLYLRVLLPDPTMNHCGVLDWRPQRLVSKAAGVTVQTITEAAAELEARHYALFDLATEEALVRSYMRNDELLRNPKMAACVIKAYGPIASKPLRAAVVTELRRLKADNPKFSSWTFKDTAEDLEKLLSRPGSDEVTYTYTYSVPNGYLDPVTNGDPEPVAISNEPPGADDISESGGDSLHLAPSTSQPAPMGGRERTEPQEGSAPDGDPPPPSRFCSKHPQGTTTGCLACKSARQEFDRVELAQREAEAEAARQARDESIAASVQAIIECDRCDDDGYIGSQVCAHRDFATAETRAAARAAFTAGIAVRKADES